MQFKIDENLPVDVADALRVAGHDALTLDDQQMCGQSDSQVAEVCQSEQRAIITLDLDFSDIRAYPPADYSGIVVLRPRIQAKRPVLNLVGQLIALLDREPLDGHLWILQENGLRIRES